MPVLRRRRRRPPARRRATAAIARADAGRHAWSAIQATEQPRESPGQAAASARPRAGRARSSGRAAPPVGRSAPAHRPAPRRTRRRSTDRHSSLAGDQQHVRHADQRRGVAATPPIASPSSSSITNRLRPRQSGACARVDQSAATGTKPFVRARAPARRPIASFPSPPVPRATTMCGRAPPAVRRTFPRRPHGGRSTIAAQSAIESRSEFLPLAGYPLPESGSRALGPGVVLIASAQSPADKPHACRHRVARASVRFLVDRRTEPHATLRSERFADRPKSTSGAIAR